MREIVSSLSRLTFVLLLFGALFLLAKPTLSSAQTQPETWFDTYNSPSLEQDGLYPRGKLSTVNDSRYYGSCFWKEILTRYFVINWPLWRQSVNACWSNSPIGLISQSGDYLATNGAIAGEIINTRGSILHSTVRPGLMIEKKSNSSNNHTTLHYGPYVESSKNYVTGSVTHTLLSDNKLVIKGPSGNNINPYWMDISKNGRWMVGATINHSLFRLDLETKKFLNFGLPIPHGAGWNPFMKISITSDGRYAVATGTASQGGQWMRLYDLGYCEDSEHDYLNSPHANCRYIDLTSFIASNVPDFNRFTMAKFGDNNTLVFYHIPKAADRKLEKYILRAPNSGSHIKSYLALGDSFASGEGAHDYFLGTDLGPKLNNCHLSKNSYPYLIGKRIGLDSYNSVACSGAKLINIVGPEDLDNDLTRIGRSNQYKDLTEYDVDPRIKGWLPGYYLQKSFIDNDTDIITLSMIGNDLGFSDKIKRCLQPDTCYETFEDRWELLHEIRGKFDDLVSLYEDVIDSGSPLAKIYVVGYPKVGYVGGDCAVNVRLNDDEIEFANQFVVELNKVIKNAAKKAGVFYVDVEDSLSGYRFCETNTYHIAMNGLTAGRDIFSVVGNESYHPNALGHILLANDIQEKTSDFTAAMPEPEADITTPTEYEGVEFLNRPLSNRHMYTVNYRSDISDDVIYHDSYAEFKAYEKYHSLYKPYSFVDVNIYSEPTHLGSVQADEIGNVEAILPIPSTIPTGFHTLHMFGKDIHNNDIDLYKTIYVAHTEDDKNGNGVEDSSEPCWVFESAGIDYDKDGTDDACDPLIDKRPPPASEESDADSINSKTSSALSESTKDIKKLDTQNSIDSDVRGKNKFIEELLDSNQTARLSGTQNYDEQLPHSPILKIFIASFLLMMFTLIYYLRYAKR